MAAEQLARLHALSHAYHQKHNFLTRFPSFNTDDRLVGFLAEFITVFYDFVVEALGEQEDLSHIIGKLKENREKLFANFKTLASRDTPGHRVICLAHGDAWTNNLMYLDSTHSPQTPEDLFLIDWGLVGWRNAIFDLHQIVYNCTSLSLRQQHLQKILERYHGTFTAATRDLGAPVPNYDLPEFLKEWERTALFGLIQSGIFANSIVLSEKAREGFVKGTPSTGLWSLLAKGFAKVMVPLVMRGWFMNVIIEDTKKKFKPLLDEMKSGNNKLLNSTLVDILREANDRGLLDL
ncbi:hypothetical protein E2C01_075188 [Portunus trituberculatus]|uniref:CHK kinase-like domain-containing protein n=1 Tax=Portunus trituberculatus TaxID=210409 RepID=A0A5B7IEG1_PORTR|nr:hypothetical protein [Portunus trituberculatus]